jgi:hypothetical protein
MGKIGTIVLELVEVAMGSGDSSGRCMIVAAVRAQRYDLPLTKATLSGEFQWICFQCCHIKFKLVKHVSGVSSHEILPSPIKLSISIYPLNYTTISPSMMMCIVFNEFETLIENDLTTLEWMASRI